MRHNLKSNFTATPTASCWPTNALGLQGALLHSCVGASWVVRSMQGGREPLWRPPPAALLAAPSPTSCPAVCLAPPPPHLGAQPTPPPHTHILHSGEGWFQPAAGDLDLLPDAQICRPHAVPTCLWASSSPALRERPQHLTRDWNRSQTLGSLGGPAEANRGVTRLLPGPDSSLYLLDFFFRLCFRATPSSAPDLVPRGGFRYCLGNLWGGTRASCL